MKVQYNKEQDILMIQLSKKKVDDAFETETMIVHTTVEKEPVLLEIFNASKFFSEESKILPQDIKTRFFAV